MNGYNANNGGISEDCTITIQDSYGGSFDFPVLPSSFEVSVKQNNSTVNINSLGELNVIGKTGLKTISLSSFFPAQEYDFVKSGMFGIKKPYQYVRQLEFMRTNGRPCRIIISNTNVNIPVLIDSFSYSEKDGSSDVYFTLSLKEYKFVGAEKDMTNTITGLKSRESWLQKTLKNVKVYKGDGVGDVLGRAIGKTEAGNPNSYCKYFKTLSKGGIKVGQSINLSKIIMH
jgi:hypothetical protein